MYPKIVSVEGGLNPRHQTLTQNIVYNINQTIVPTQLAHFPNHNASNSVAMRGTNDEFHFPVVGGISQMHKLGEFHEPKRGEDGKFNFPRVDATRSYAESHHHQGFSNKGNQTQVSNHLQGNSYMPLPQLPQLMQYPHVQTESKAGKVKKERPKKKSKYDVPDSLLNQELKLKSTAGMFSG